MATLLNHLVPLLMTFSENKFAAYRQEWEVLDAYRHQPVCVTSAAEVIEGIARGVFDNGALRLACTGGEKAIYVGDVSLRLVDAS